jgi:hypothetical protein
MAWIKRAVLTALYCAAARAGPITFTETIANASGVLDGTAFTSQTVTLVLTSDTSTVINVFPGLYKDFGTATVSVSGGGTDTFIGPKSIPYAMFWTRTSRRITARCCIALPISTHVLPASKADLV